MSASAVSPAIRTATQRVAMFSVATSTLLIIIKAIAWQASSSIALLASLSDSVLDLMASLITLFAVRVAIPQTAAWCRKHSTGR